MVTQDERAPGAVLRGGCCPVGIRGLVLPMDTYTPYRDPCASLRAPCAVLMTLADGLTDGGIIETLTRMTDSIKTETHCHPVLPTSL